MQIPFQSNSQQNKAFNHGGTKHEHLPPNAPKRLVLRLPDLDAPKLYRIERHL